MKLLKVLSLGISLLASPSVACEVTKTRIIAYTYHAGAQKGFEFDEGLSLRGAGLTVNCNEFELSPSVYRTSSLGERVGFSLSLTHESVSLSEGGLTLKPILQANYYPEWVDSPMTWEGWFLSAGVVGEFAVTDRVSLYTSLYPTFNRDVFDLLVVSGVSYNF